MTDPILAKNEVASLVDAQRIRLGLSWKKITDTLDVPLVWGTAALLGQHPLPEDVARKAVEILQFPEEEHEAVIESLTAQPSRGIDPELLQDPTIYRFQEALMVYGPALKHLIHEEFGDGIMSAINFKVDFARRPDPDGDRVVVTFDGKFLDYRW